MLMLIPITFAARRRPQNTPGSRNVLFQTYKRAESFGLYELAGNVCCSERATSTRLSVGSMFPLSGRSGHANKNYQSRPGMDHRRRLGLQPANRAPRAAAAPYEVASTVDAGAAGSVLAIRRGHECGGEDDTSQGLRARRGEPWVAPSTNRLHP